MKKLFPILALWASISQFSFADKCTPQYRHDPCPVGNYSVVETEPYKKGVHNCMAIAHYFPGEEPEGYCDGQKGKRTARPASKVIPVR